jgi:nucleoside-diphosphate-sugar epimerase
MQVLVTGAAGFVGRVLCGTLAAAGHTVHAAVRGAAGAPPGATSVRAIGDLATFDGWEPVLQGIDAVVHLAARVHVMRDTAADPQAAFDAVNATATERLARACARAGARRFVFFSSVKVNGEGTGQQAFTETDPPAPADPYGRSKLEAERAIARIAVDGGLEPVVLRPPLVYGPGVGGNVLRLMRLIERGVPLPLGAVRNRRSMVSVWNLADATRACVVDPRAAGRTFLVSDGDDLSTPRMIAELARGMDRPARLLPVPPVLLRAAAALLGLKAEVDRLCGSLQVDASAIGHTLAWTPPVTADEGLRRTGRAWRERARGQTW